MRLIRACIAGGLIFLCGCASLPQAAPSEDQNIGQGGLQGFRFSGRLAVHQPSGTDTGKIDWVSKGSSQHVELLTPLGSTAAVLDCTPQSVHLVLSDHSEFWATDSEQLTRSVLGYALPLEGLPWWVLGQTAPLGEATLTRDAEGNPDTLMQAGWQIHYADWRRVGDRMLPGNLLLKHDDLAIRLRVDQWIVERGDK
ncbi:MAG: lipoprotein insertase outer membrane protein LolB [Burkholderiales bacterium]